MNNVTYKKGICSTCQSEVIIQKSPIPRQEELARLGDDIDNDIYIDMQYGDNINYICVDHNFFGEKCEGSNCIPQFVLKDN